MLDGYMPQPRVPLFSQCKASAYATYSQEAVPPAADLQTTATPDHQGQGKGEDHGSGCPANLHEQGLTLWRA